MSVSVLLEILYIDVAPLGRGAAFNRHRCGDKRSGVGIRGCGGAVKWYWSRGRAGEPHRTCYVPGRGRSAAFTMELGALNKMPRGGQKFLGCTICLEADRVFRSLCVAKNYETEDRKPGIGFPALP